MMDKEKAFKEIKWLHVLIDNYDTLRKYEIDTEREYCFEAGFDARDKEVAELKETLKYYADMNLYHMTAGGSIYIQDAQPWLRARKALEKSDE